MGKPIDLKSSLHISLPSELLGLFNEYSQDVKLSRNQIIAELIEQWIEDQEDIRLAKKVMQDIKEGTTETISHTDMKKRLGW